MVIHAGSPFITQDSPSRERRVPTPSVLTRTGAWHAQDQVGIEPHPPKGRRASNTRDTISRPWPAKEPLPRVDGFSGAQRAALERHPAGPDVVGPVRSGIPGRVAHERTDRRPQHAHQEPWSEIHASPHKDPGTNGSCDHPLPLCGRPNAMSPAHPAQPHHERSALKPSAPPPAGVAVGGPDLPMRLVPREQNPSTMSGERRRTWVRAGRVH
jgi:hypothetical protein